MSRSRERGAHLRHDFDRGIIEQPLDLASYVVFDLENTGGNPEKNGITEVCALRYRNGQVEETFYTLVNPRRSIPPIVRRMTGITDRMVRNAPVIEDVMPSLLEFIGDDILVSHNTIGDLRFLQYFGKKCCKKDVQNFFLCTHLLATKLISHSPDKSLSGLGKFLNLHFDESHRAEADARLTLELFKVLLALLKEAKIVQIEEAIRFQGDMDSSLRLGTSLQAEDFAKLPQGPGVFHLLDGHGHKMFSSSAFHLCKDAQSLTNYGQLPKPLLKMVLKSKEITFDASVHIFDAMIEEGKSREQHQQIFDASKWHLRSVSGFCLKLMDTGTYVLNVGTVEVNCIGFWGPVWDYKAAGEALERLAAYLQSNLTRSGVVIPPKKVGMLREYFSQAFSIRELWGKGLSHIVGLRPTEQNIFATWKDFHQLSKELPLKNIHDLLSVNGVVGASIGQDSVALYSIEDSNPTAPIIISGDAEDWFVREEGQEFLKNLLKNKTQRKRFPSKYSKASTLVLINATLWMIYAFARKKQNRTRFWTLEELKSFSNRN